MTLLKGDLAGIAPPGTKPGRHARLRQNLFLEAQDLARRAARETAEAAAAGAEPPGPLADAAGCRIAPAPAVFTHEGLIELRAMRANRRLAETMKFAHIREELGIDPVSSPAGVAGQSRRQ